MSDIKYVKEVNYGDNINNYAMGDELTVTITLREYRELLLGSGKQLDNIEFKVSQMSEILRDIKDSI